MVNGNVIIITFLVTNTLIKINNNKLSNKRKLNLSDNFFEVLIKDEKKDEKTNKDRNF